MPSLRPRGVPREALRRCGVIPVENVLVFEGSTESEKRTLFLLLAGVVAIVAEWTSAETDSTSGFCGEDRTLLRLLPLRRAIGVSMSEALC